MKDELLNSINQDKSSSHSSKGRHYPFDIETLLKEKPELKLTPMMEQYFEIKKKNPDHLLLFRMGDFYEVFFEDAQIISKALNISLTKRGKLGDTDIPMAGIPHHAAKNYVDRLTEQNFSVAICEQIEDPKHAKGIVKRDVVQVVTKALPYTIDETSINLSNYLISISKLHEKNKDYFSIAVIDYTTGQFFAQTFESFDILINKITTLAPNQIILSMGILSNDEQKAFEDILRAKIRIEPTYLSLECFEHEKNKQLIEKLVPGIHLDQKLKHQKSLHMAISGLSVYLHSTQGPTVLNHLDSLKILQNENSLKLSEQCIDGLEIYKKNSKDLFSLMDFTQTTMGKRHLKEIFFSPTQNMVVLNNRHDFISTQSKLKNTFFDFHKKLNQILDINKLLSKILTKKPLGQDLLNLSHSIIHSIQVCTDSYYLKHCKQFLEIEKNEFKQIYSISKKIQNAINDELGAQLEKGNLIRPGFCSKRDNLKDMSEDHDVFIKRLEDKYKRESKATKLRIKKNNVIGYYIEVTKNQSSNIPEYFERRQTLVNTERYVTKELKDFEYNVRIALDELLKRDGQIFQEIIELIHEAKEDIYQLSYLIAQLDSYCSLAQSAIHFNYCRPEFTKEKKFKIKQAWHPLIKTFLNKDFVHHDIELDSHKHFALITGPNMAGKTTVMREMAIIQFLSQIGSFVPAESVQIRLADQIFIRVGASDNITQGMSTFMVEMSESAAILRHASENSLIIIDEIGRGTSTVDGLSIARSILEYFHNEVKCFCFFSTHYHELIQVCEDLERAQNYTVAIKESNNDIHFLYKLIPKASEKSFGIHVARMAGLPIKILSKSEEYLKFYEENLFHTIHDKKSESIISHEAIQPQTQVNIPQYTDDNKQMCLFPLGSDNEEQKETFKRLKKPDHQKESQSDLQSQKILDRILKLDLFNSTPIEVLNYVHKIQATIKKHKKDL